jgi:hypothetical protein
MDEWMHSFGYMWYMILDCIYFTFPIILLASYVMICINDNDDDGDDHDNDDKLGRSFINDKCIA